VRIGRGVLTFGRVRSVVLALWNPPGDQEARSGPALNPHRLGLDDPALRRLREALAFQDKSWAALVDLNHGAIARDPPW
jgi:hypothetical protein